ncbi:MAG TPA: hypothetical protein VJW20_24905 [Candidatus Angelobacter sp.]|nr:hypothetical protein [Candidatus Angelobacter sp.]
MHDRLASLILSAALVLASPAIIGQQPATSTAPAADSITGPIIQVEMNSDVDVKKAHPGDVFRTRVWEDVRSGDKVVLPQKTIIVGHVVAAQPRTKENPDSKLTIAFDKAVLKNGSELPLHGIVERVELSSMAVAAADRNSPSYNSGLNPGSTTNVAMPNSGGADQQQIAPGPTYIRDSSIALQGDASGNTVLTSTTKADVKLKHFATLDVRITKIGQ